jgi:hypothetical protein
MSIQPNTNKLIIPNKNYTPTQQKYGQDMRTIEQWASGSVRSVVAGTNVSVDDTDPQNPVVSSTGSGGGYASLTGPGETTTPGDLTQAGNLIIGSVASPFALETEIITSLSNTTRIEISRNGVIGYAQGITGSLVQLGATSQQTLVQGSDVAIQGDGIGSQVNIGVDGLQAFEAVENSGAAQLGFYNHTPVSQAAHPVTLADVITLLTNLGLCA